MKDFTMRTWINKSSNKDKGVLYKDHGMLMNILERWGNPIVNFEFAGIKWVRYWAPTQITNSIFRYSLYFYWYGRAGTVAENSTDAFSKNLCRFVVDSDLKMSHIATFSVNIVESYSSRNRVVRLQEKTREFIQKGGWSYSRGCCRHWLKTDLKHILTIL